MLKPNQPMIEAKCDIIEQRCGQYTIGGLAMRIEHNILINVEPRDVINGIFTVPDGITSVGYVAFMNCESLTNITLPESLTSIGDCTFWGCRSLTNIILPESLTSIGDSAFTRCSSLTNITLPESLTSIGKSAFAGCCGLTSITLPKSLTSIGNFVFAGCCSLTNITLPERLASIGDYAFLGCHHLTNITLPESLTSIGGSAFEDCSRLTNITLPENLTSIGEGAFARCSRLTSIILPESLTSIGESAFVGCSSLTHINIIANTSQEFERIKSYLPNDLRPKATDIIEGIRIKMSKLEQHIDHARNTEKELSEEELEAIEQLQTQLDGLINYSIHQDLQQRMDNIITMRMMWFLENNQLNEAVECFINTPNPSTDMARELASALFAYDNTIETHQSILALFKKHDEDTDVRTLLERSVLSTLSLLSRGQPARLSDKIADYAIDRCLPCACILSTINQIPELDEALRKQLNDADALLPMLNAREIHQLITTSPLKEAFIKQYGSTNIITYESVLLLSSKEEVDALCQYPENQPGAILTASELDSILQQAALRARPIESTQHRAIQPAPIANSLGDLGLFSSTIPGENVRETNRKNTSLGKRKRPSPL